MSALVRCPQCNTFVKPASINSGSCTFCPTSSPGAKLRNAIPGMVLAATIAAAPACSGGAPRPEVTPVYGISAEESEVGDPDAGVPDNSNVDPDTSTETPDKPDEVPVPVYGMAPIPDEQ